jgi:Protein of unknown function (DUF3293)
MADQEQQIEGLPQGATVRPIQQPTPAASDPSQVEGLPEGATLRPVTPPVQNKATATTVSPKPVTTRRAPTVKTTSEASVEPEKDALTSADENNAALPSGVQVAVKVARGVRGLYHGVMGDEETTTSKGPTSTASPVAENLGFTPEHIGQKVGEMGRGIYEFGKGLASDLLSTKTPVIIPDKPNTLEQQLKNATGTPYGDPGISDPKAHTLLAKYITAPSQAEHEAAVKELEEYGKTHGTAAVGHAISAFLHGTLGEYVSAVGPLAMALTDQAAKGDIGGALAQLGSLYAFEKGTGTIAKGLKDRVGAKVEEITKTPKVKQAEENTKALAKDREAAQTKYDTAKAKYDQHIASHEQGIEAPKGVKSALDKAQGELDEATAHHELAAEREAKLKAESTVPKRVGGAIGQAVGKVLPTKPEVPAEQVEASPALQKLGTPVPVTKPVKPINVKGPGEVQPETFPQTPKPAPRPPLGKIELANGQGTVGTQKLLTEGTPAGPEAPKGGLPKIAEQEAPKGGLPKIAEQEAPKSAAKPETGNIKSLKAVGGKVVDTEDTVEGRVGKLLQEALKPGESKSEAKEAPAEYKGEERREKPRPAPMSPVEIEQAMKSRKPVHTPFDVTEGAKETIERDQAMPKHPAEEATKPAEAKPVLPKEEATGYTPKKEELAGINEGKNEPTSAAEYHPEVRQRVFELGNEDLKALARAHGLDPNAPEYAFGKGVKRTEATETSSGRQQPGRAKLADDVTAQMSDEEKINIGRNARQMDREGTFDNQDVSNLSRAEQAKKLFPRLREGEAAGGYGSKNKLVSKEEAEAAKKRFNDKATRSNAGVDPTMFVDAAKVAAYHIEAGVRSFAEFSEEMIKSLGEGIRPHLQSLYEQAQGKNALEAAAGETTRQAADSPDAKPVLDHIKSGKDFALLTAENPNNTRADAADNAKRNREMKADLEKMGYKPVEIEGHNADVEGEKENSFFVPDISPKDAAKISKKYGQASVMTKEGIHDLSKDTVHPAGKMITGPEAAKQEYHSTVGGEPFSIPVDFDKEVKNFPESIDRPKTTVPKDGKALPTRDQLVKKYGEAQSYDPKAIAFILDDGTRITNTGTDHDHMLGGKATAENPPRERFVKEGNIRVREHQGAGGRTVAFSIPESGINAAQWEVIKKMSPMLSSGGVGIEIGQMGGKYDTIEYGEASPERLQQAINKVLEPAAKAKAQSLGSARAGGAKGNPRTKVNPR